MKKLLKSYINQDVYILGYDITKVIETFSLTDDYQSLRLQFKDDYSYMETVGYCFILTQEELDLYRSKIEVENSHQDDTYCVKLTNYIGDIYLNIINDDTKKSVLKKNLDLSEYIMDQATKDLSEISFTIQLEIDTEIKNCKKFIFL